MSPRELLLAPGSLDAGVFTSLFPARRPRHGEARDPLRRLVAPARPVDLLAAAHLVRELVVRGADRLGRRRERPEEEPVPAAVEGRLAAREVGAVFAAALRVVAVGEGVGREALGARGALVVVAGVGAGVGRADVRGAVVACLIVCVRARERERESELERVSFFFQPGQRAEKKKCTKKGKNLSCSSYLLPPSSKSPRRAPPASRPSSDACRWGSPRPRPGRRRGRCRAEGCRRA